MTGDFHIETIPVSLRAARALCNKEQAEIAEQAKMARETVKAAEKGNWWTPSHRALQDYYESEGIEFTGWGETATGKFYGVGVRWKSAGSSPEDEHAALPSDPGLSRP